MDKEAIGNRISKLREEAGLSQSSLARLLNVSSQAVQQWEAAQTAPRGKRLDALAALLKSSPQFIMFGEEPSFNPGIPIRSESLEIVDQVTPRVPLISWVQAGFWMEQDFVRDLNEVEAWFPSPKKVGGRSFALRVRGASMEPKFQDGDIIFVDPDVPADHGRNVVAMVVDTGETTFKHLIVEGSYRYLMPLNKDWPGPKFMEVDDNVRICGVVVGKWVDE
jgi:SOS-response transcriptional repressor LexA